MPAPATQAEHTVRARIRQQGRITFAEFMALALYGPGGYYTSGEPIGRGGDYYTSPLVHPLFGALLALQAEQLWRLLGQPYPFTIAEPGAGDGRLAADVTAYARHLDPAFHRALRYIAIDRCPRSRGGDAIAWAASDALPMRDITGLVLSNELADALPVHRVVLSNGRLMELYVTEGDGRLIEERGEPSTPALAKMLEAHGVCLQEGWQAEVSLAAAQWMESVARALRRGYVITFDYGGLADELATEQRRRGTVMAYYRHTSQSDPYARVGLQDLTAHANFTTLIQAGQSHGLQPITLLSQGELLMHLGAERFIARLHGLGLAQPVEDANRLAMRDLLKPSGLGRFRVLAQAKAAPPRPIAGLGLDGPARGQWLARLDTLPVPLLTSQHLDLLAARYPHLAR